MNFESDAALDLGVEHRADLDHAVVTTASAVTLGRVAPSVGAPNDRDAAFRPNRWRRTFRVRRLLADVVAVTVIGVLAFLSWPATLGGATSYVIVRGASMEPKFHTGDVAVVRAQGHYAKGDVIAYRVPKGNPAAGRLVIHRIVGSSPDGFVTQGDNRATPDSWHPKPHDILGRYRTLIPMPGISAWTLLPWVCCALIGIAVTWFLWPRASAEAPHESNESNESSAGTRAGTRAGPGGNADSDAAPGRDTPVIAGQRRIRRQELEAKRAEGRRRAPTPVQST